MGNLTRRLLAAGGVVGFVFGFWLMGGVAHANCATMPDDPMCQPAATSPPATSPPHTSPPQSQTNTHVTSNSSTNNNTPTPQPGGRTVTRTPPKENLTPRRQPTFTPSVPAATDAPAENFEPAAADPVPLPAVDLGQVPIPQAAPAPPPPPPPNPSSNGPGPAPLALGGALGLAGGAAIAQKQYDDDFKSSVTGGTLKMGGGIAVIAGVGAGIQTGALAIGATALAGPALFALGFGLVFLGAVDLLSLPKVQPTGPAAHAGSTRG